jgi:uncharacterized protein
MLRKNPFVHTFYKGKNIALFNALTLSTLYLTKPQYQFLIKDPPKHLIDDKLFVAEDFSAINYLKDYMESHYRNEEITTAFFLLTDACNLRCKYCFEDTPQKHKPLYMSEEIAEKGVRLLAKNTKGIRQINFFGGEPLLNLKAIKKIIATTKKLNLDVDQFMLITNGCFIDDEIADFLKENDIFVSISLDGSKKINDRARKDSRGRGAYEEALKGIEALDKKKASFGIGCTVGNHNYNCPGNISSVLEKFNIKNVAFNFLSPNKGMQIDEEIRETMFRKAIKAAEKMFEKDIVENKIIYKKLRSFIKGTPRFKECAGYGNQIAIAPDGKVGPCHHNFWLDSKKANTYFDIDIDYKGKITKHPTWIEWSNRTPLNMPQCWNCFGIGLCGGGCSGNSLMDKGNIWEVDDVLCSLTKQTVPWAIWKYYELVRKSSIIEPVMSP